MRQAEAVTSLKHAVFPPGPSEKSKAGPGTVTMVSLKSRSPGRCKMKPEVKSVGQEQVDTMCIHKAQQGPRPRS